MDKQVDSYRFQSFVTRKLIRAWIEREPQRPIPWTAPAEPLAGSTIALVSTAALAMAGDRPFDQQGERKNPWWGDPSFRVIPKEATTEEVRAYHLHLDNRYVQEDLGCALPTERLLDLERSGEIGRAASSHYSIMGYILQPEELIAQSTPAMIARMQSEQVDVVLLAPY